MIALCVDDEPLMLRSLIRKVELSPDVEYAKGFTDAEEAIEWTKENPVDLAFLDIQLRGMEGIDLAKKLREWYPQLPVFFCTGFQNYALEAMQIHANGYLVKPFAASDVQKEIDHLKSERSYLESQILKKQQESGSGVEVSGKEKLLRVRCFGNFDAFSGNSVLTFKRTKTKELFAYLIDRKGAMITAGELCAVLWPDNFDERSNIRYLMQLVIDLRETLKTVNASELLIAERRKGYAVDCEQIDCDYYRYLEGEEAAIRLFQGEYMKQYEWGEIVLMDIIKKRRK